MLGPQLLPTLPLSVHVEPQFTHLTRIHEWDDPGWLPKLPATIRSFAYFHTVKDQPKEK